MKQKYILIRERILFSLLKWKYILLLNFNQFNFIRPPLYLITFHIFLPHSEENKINEHAYIIIFIFTSLVFDFKVNKNWNIQNQFRIYTKHYFIFTININIQKFSFSFAPSFSNSRWKFDNLKYMFSEISFFSKIAGLRLMLY